MSAAARMGLDAYYLPGYDAGIFAGANENARLADLIAAAPPQPYAYRSDSHIGFVRDTAPLNYAGTRAALVIQQRDSGDAISNELPPGVMFQFTSTGNGFVNAAIDLSMSIWMGVTAVQTKSGDGSAHCFTAIGQLLAYGPGLYNELGLFQGTGTNIGSIHGTISGVEMLIRDGVGATHFDTFMHAIIGRIGREHNGAKDAANFFVSSEGTFAPNAMFGVNNAGLRQWLRGFDLKDAIFNTGQALLLPNNTSLAWMDGVGVSAVPIMFLSGADEFWFTGAKASTGITFANSALAIAFRIKGVASTINYFEVTGGVAGQVPLMFATGADANVGAAYSAKGTGVHSFYTGGITAKQFEVSHTASSVNFIQVAGGAAGSPARVRSAGADANIDIALVTKGTGVIDFASAVLSVAATTGPNAKPAGYSGFVNIKINGSPMKLGYYNP